MNPLPVRRSTLGALLATAFLTLPNAGRACQYCRQGEDPEAYRFMNEGRIGGGFPVDAGLGQYAGAPGVAPAAANVVNPPAAPAAADAPVINAAAIAPPPPAAAVSRPPAAAPALPAGVPGTAAVAAPAGRLPAATARWADLGLLGLLGLGAWFGWRTRPGRQRQTLA